MEINGLERKVKLRARIAAGGSVRPDSHDRIVIQDMSDDVRPGGDDVPIITDKCLPGGKTRRGGGRRLLVAEETLLDGP